jgi:polysaccharide export outer membrane protein
MKRVALSLSVLASIAAPVAAQQPAASAGVYHINPGDQVDIYVWGDERLQRSMTVLPDGSFAFPLAGTVQAAGRTPAEIEQMLSKLLADQYKGVPPQVTVSVKVPAMQVSVIGKVRSPGTFSPSRYLSVLDALALAGGPADFADLGNVAILRRTGGKNTVLHVRLADVLKGRPSASDLSSEGMPMLMPGDTVVVP